MTAFVYATPPTTRTREVPRWDGASSTWTGWDGSVWDLSSLTSGVALLTGTRGYGKPEFVRHTSSAPSVAGTRFRGVRADEREVFWRVGVFSDEGSQAWIEYDRAFWRTMDPRRPGVWAVRQPSGSTRTLVCRYVSESDPAWLFSPGLVGWKHYGIYLVAESPFWRGATVLRSWKAAEPVPFFGVDGAGGPPFNISSSSTLGSASVDNPGDEDTHVIWLVSGPTQSATVGITGRPIDIPFPVADGRVLVVDTAPTSQTAKEIVAPPARGQGEAPYSAAELEAWIASQMPSAVNRTRELGSEPGGAIPPGKSVDLSLSMVGAGMVQMLMTPLFHRAI